MIGCMHDEIQAIFEQAGCQGALLVQSLDAAYDTGTETAATAIPTPIPTEFGLRADEPAIPSSVIKVLIALVAETWFVEGRLDPREPVTIPAAGRTPGPVGLSLFQDDVTLSWRDMVVLMLTISDNACTDALIRALGLDAVNATAARLRLTATSLESDLMTMLDSIGQDLGRADWDDLIAWSASATADESARADTILPTAAAFDPARGTRTSPRDMVSLLRQIWDGSAGPAEACARVRAVMAKQLTRNRLASAFRPPVRVAAKSGSLMGIVRNEIGVVTYPDGHRYAAAVFTRSRPGADDGAISAAIGAAAARAVAVLRSDHPMR